MSKVKIMLVDDRKENLDSLCAILNYENYHLVRCASGGEALKVLLTSGEFACILLDVRMPEIDGHDVAKIIRSDPAISRTPIIFVTASEVKYSDIIDGYKDGAVDYLIKPLDPLIVRSKVACFVQLFEQRKQLEEQNHLLEKLTEELKVSNRELEQFNRLAIDREMRMIEMKRMVNDLSLKLNLPEPFDLSFAK